MLLRALSTMRAIDWVLTKTAKTEIQAELKQKLVHLIEEIKQFQLNILQGKRMPNSITSMEQRFNLFLKHTLIAAGLADGLNTHKDFEAILTHYRNLASTLDSAKTLVTIQQYGSFTHTETAYPITKKTAEQQAQLSTLISPPRDRPDFNHSQTLAMQVANYWFYELIANDNRRLPAGTRSTIAPTAKNSYAVYNEITDGSGFPIADFWL